MDKENPNCCLLFLGLHLGHTEVPRLGVKSELQLAACIPQPQQCQIRAVSATYTTANSNTQSLTHWARPGIEPATSRHLVRFVSTVPGQTLQEPNMLKEVFPHLKDNQDLSCDLWDSEWSRPAWELISNYVASSWCWDSIFCTHHQGCLCSEVRTKRGGGREEEWIFQRKLFLC